jgi:hypothetical protein
VLTGDVMGAGPPMEHPRSEHAFDSRLQEAVVDQDWGRVHADGWG